jgi:hypothetical protein
LFLDQAERHLKVKTPFTADAPLPCILIGDATDLRACKTVTSGKQGYQLQGGEYFGNLIDEAAGDRADVKALEEEYANLGRALDHAIDSNSDLQTTDRVVLLAFMESHTAELTGLVAESAKKLADMRARYHVRNDGTDVFGLQKTFLTMAMRRWGGLKAAFESASKSIGTLRGFTKINEVDLIELMESLVVVVTELFVGATHYMLLMLQTPDSKVVVPVARVYYRDLDKSGTIDIMKRVAAVTKEATAGRCSVAGVSTDGEFRCLRELLGGRTAESDARVAKKFVDDMALAAADSATSTETDAGQPDDDEGGAIPGGGELAADAATAEAEAGQRGAPDAAAPKQTKWGHVQTASAFVAVADFALANMAPGTTPHLAGQHDSGVFMVPHAQQRPVVATAGADARADARRQKFVGRAICMAVVPGGVREFGTVSAVDHATAMFTVQFNSGTIAVSEVDMRTHQGGDSAGDDSPLIAVVHRSETPLWKVELLSSPSVLAGPRAADILDPALAAEIAAIVAAIPSPVRPPPKPIKRGARAIGLPPPSGVASRFLTGAQMEQEGVITHERERARQFLVKKRLLEVAKEAKIRPLSTTSALKKLRDTATALGVPVPNTVGADMAKKEAVIKAILTAARAARGAQAQQQVAGVAQAQQQVAGVAQAQQQVAGGAQAQQQVAGVAQGNGAVLDLYLQLEEARDYPVSLKLDVSLGDMKHFAANVRLAQLRKEANAKGRFYDTPEAGQVYAYDPLHLFHNFVQSLMKQLTDKGGEDARGERVLKLETLQRATDNMKDELLSRILAGSFDRHSHLCTSLVVSNPELVAELRRMGEFRQAKVLEIVGGAYAAWCVPGSTEAARTRSLHLLIVLVRRLFGGNLDDVNVLTSMSFGGFPTKQWLDLLANADAYAMFLERLSPELRATFKTLALSTHHVESSFSQIPQASGSSVKPSVSELQGRAHKLDQAASFKRNQDHNLTFRFSRRKQKQSDEMFAGSWNDGGKGGGAAAFEKRRRSQAMRYTTNRASVRLFNKRKGLEGPAAAF